MQPNRDIPSAFLKSLPGSHFAQLSIVNDIPIRQGAFPAPALAGGTAAASYAAGHYTRRAYTTSGTELDFVSGLGIDSVCQ